MSRVIASLLRWIIGRIKMYMYTAGLAFSLMLVPLGYYLVIEGQNLYAQTGGYLSVITGIILFLIVLSKSIQEEKQAKKSNEDKFNELVTEIRGLREDLNNIRQDRNERDNKSG